MRKLFAAFFALGFLPSMVDGMFQESQPGGPGGVVDVTRLGPQVGEKVPNFSLPDQRGEGRTLSSLLGPEGMVLVFARSADW